MSSCDEDGLPEDGFPPAARGSFTPDEEFVREGNHLEGWNNAITDALLTFRRKPGQTYQVTWVLSAVVEEQENPGRITQYIATGI